MASIFSSNAPIPLAGIIWLASLAIVLIGHFSEGQIDFGVVGTVSWIVFILGIVFFILYVIGSLSGR